MFDNLSTRLQAIASRLRGQAKLTEADLDDALREVRLALLEADVNFRVVKSFVAHVREQAIGTDILEGVRPGHQVVKLVHDELVEILGRERYQLHLDGSAPAGRPDGRPPGIGQDDVGREARPSAAARRPASRPWSRPTSIGRPPSSSSSASASRSRSRC